MKKILFLFFLFALIMSFSNCNREGSDNVNQDKIWAEYVLHYDANQDITYARVNFRFSNATGTKLELTEPAEVRFEGELLSWKPALAYYERQMTGFVDAGKFRYIDLDNDTFINEVRILSAIAFPPDLDTLPTSASYEMFWVGDSLTLGETVSVFIKGTLQNDLQTIVTNAQYAKSIIFPLNKLEKLGKGAGLMTMHRDYRNILEQQTSAGGSRVGHYRAKDRNIIVGD